MSGLADITVRQGNTHPMFIWEFFQDETTPLDLSGSELVFKTSHGLRLSTDTAPGFVLSPVAGRVTWTPTLAESRGIPSGRVVKYEIERRAVGEQRTLVSGYIIGVLGINDDA